MITLFQIDKSGNDVFEKDYSLVLVLNKTEVYGINIPQSIKDNLNYLFKKGELNINHKSEKQKKNRFRIRFHTGVIILLIKQAIRDLGNVDELSIALCNDIDGHFHEIKDMIFKHFTKLIPSLKPEDILLTKFQKPSLIDTAGRAFRTRDKDKLKEYTQIKLDEIELINIIRK
jgi:hypothetical protein